MYPRFNVNNEIKTPFVFFTGKGGVGKTSTACATAVSLADQGKKVLLVSTDPASNLQDVFEMDIKQTPTPIQGFDHLFALNIDPEEAARVHREKVVGPYRGLLPDSAVAQMEESLSGACTVEIAAFDEFTHLLADEEIVKKFDHILFDTAPTGHTLRLLQLPNAWSGFLEESTHGVSCLGPLAGLNEKKDLYSNTVKALSNPKQTSLFLIARPEQSSLKEAARAAHELFEIGIKLQNVVINGVFEQTIKDDEVSETFYNSQQNALANVSKLLGDLPIFSLPFVSFSLTGVKALRYMFNPSLADTDSQRENKALQIELPELEKMVNDFDRTNKRVIFTMGKGGVGKTTVATAIAFGLAERGNKVHLTTTDPAAHIDNMLSNKEELKNLTVSRIDPKAEIAQYTEEVLQKSGEHLDEEGLAFLKEDLSSPCTEEIAVFRAFADIVFKADEEVIVIDTAPTGHTLLLLDAAESYHKEIERSTGEVSDSVKNLLPRLRNPRETSVVIVTLPEATPVLEAERLQKDLQRAKIIPEWWVINQSLYATVTKDPILLGRAYAEVEWILNVQEKLTKKIAIIPWNKG